MMKPEDCWVIYQLRNSLLHSFGLYSKTESGTVYRFVLTDSGTGPLVSPEPNDKYVVDLQVLHQSFEAAVNNYHAALKSNSLLQSNFDAMFGTYGSISIK